MKNNRVKHFRNKAQLSQRQLAAAVGTSQQQIQRIETGALVTRLDLAKKLSAVLGEPLDSIFPGSGKVMKKLQSEFKTSPYVPNKTYSELSEVGVEADVAKWTLKLLLRGHDEELQLEIPPSERRRLYGLVQGESDRPSFVVFDTERARVAVNLGELAYCQFLFDVGIVREPSADEEDDGGVEIYFAGSRKRFDFTPEADAADSDDEESEGDFGNIFWSLETDPQPYERYRFTDVDGEDVFLRVGDLALLKVPLWVVKPELLDAEENEEQEPNAAGDGSKD
jgi:DNA-binding XRE family transcriptional regulator